jgi:hypothetical protein
MATTTQIGSIQQSIPAELMPYFNQAESSAGAGDQGILPQARQLTTRSYQNVYGNALDAAGLSGANRIASLSPMQQQVGEEVKNLQLAAPLKQAEGVYSGMTDTNQVAKYMNPYAELALAPQIQAATRNAQINSVNQDRGSARAGTYGGARNILAQQESNRNLQTQLGNITAQGLNTAYDTAMKNQLAQAQGMGALGQAQNTANLQNIQTQGAYGDLQRAIQQQQLDTNYADVMRRADFPMEQVGNMANILRGVPIAQTGGTTTTNTPAPSFASQLTGLGIAGLGLARQLGG